MSQPTEPEDPIERLARAGGRVLAGTPVILAYAYGSRAGGTPRPESDLDVGYYLRDRGSILPIGEEMALASRLSDATGVEVDLRNLGPAPLELRGRVLEEGIRVYSSDEVLRVNLERDLLGRYHDYKEKLLRLHEERLRSFARSGL